MLEELDIQCPHCGAFFLTTADPSAGNYSTIEDCEVCCRPMTIRVSFDEDGMPWADVEAA
ncbi:MAG: CPXCG motif-containing cysteine-rich protein [Candidatus Methylacidiphilales bacterium]|nr:CPXCG motif-containing cysteine-rich protein [Candidatus Methylacidiphilales bacterium]